MAPRTSKTGGTDDWMAKVKSATVPKPARKPTRDYSSKGSKIPGLHEKMWRSYTTGETVVFGCPPDKVADFRSEMLKAKNYLNHLHRDDEPRVDIRGIGMEKTDLEIVDPADIVDPKLRTKYRAAVQPGWVGVVFTARPPLMKGARAGREKAEQAVRNASTPQARKDATVREITSKARGRKAADGETIPPVSFSG